MQIEEKILELLEKLALDVNEVKDGQKELSAKIDRINDRLEDMDSRNAASHVEIMGKLDELKHDVNFIQMATGKNMTDIAALKLVK